MLVVVLEALTLGMSGFRLPRKRHALVGSTAVAVARVIESLLQLFIPCHKTMLVR